VVWAQQGVPPAPPTIVEISYNGLEQLTEETLNYYLGVEVGDPMNLLELDRQIHVLWERKLVDDIELLAEEVEGGIRLIVNLVERPILRSVDYKGFKKLGDTEMQDRLGRERVQVVEGAPVDLGELERARSVLLDMYHEKGYRFAEVSYSFEETGSGDQRVVFTSDTGDKVKIDEVNFEGNTIFSDMRLKFMMRKTRPAGPISSVLKRDVYNPANFEEDLDRVRDLYREQGYKNVTILDPEIDIQPKSQKKPDGKRRLHLTIPIDEGSRWRFGEITIDGNEVFSDELLLGIFARPGGKWLKASAIDEGVEAIGEIYRNSGYLYSQVESELKEREEGVADILIHIFEGDQYRVGRLEFEGNTRTRDKVLRREFRVQEGMVLNMGGVKNSLFKIGQLGYFALDENNPVEFENFDSEKQTVDVVVNGEESDRTELLFGGGWSELDGFFVQMSVRTQNFLGRGETVGLSFQTGTTRKSFDLSYLVPWFLDRPQSVGFSVFNRQFDYLITTGQRQMRKQIGGTVSYGRSFGLFQSGRLTLGVTDIEDRTQFVDPTDPDGTVTLNQFVYKKNSFRPSWQFNSLDSRIEPTRGMRAGGSVEFAGSFLGGDISYIRPEIRFSYFKPVTQRIQTVFGTSFSVGSIEPFAGSDLPILERYYIGGSRSVRGFATRSIFLRDEAGIPIRENGQVLGGRTFFQANVEYHFLLGGPFRLIFYVDAGNVFDPDFGLPLTFDRMRLSSGAELRLFIPMFGVPLRFIYAKNLDPLPGDRFETFQFDIGASF